MKNRPHTQHGFTVPEVILIVSALAIVTAMAMPDIAFFMGRQSVEQEKLSLGNIQKALDSYARECRKLPEPTNNPPRSDCNTGTSGGLTWYEALASFSNMSASNIQKDVWDNDRLYTHGTNTRSYREGDVIFHYATVRSVGPDRVNDSATPVTGDRVSDGWTTSQEDWDISSGDISPYANFTPNGDDLMVKYTDSQWKVDAQDESVQRMQRIVDALDRYAQARFNKEVNEDKNCISEKLFYPPSVSKEPPGAEHSNTNHPNDNCTDLGRFISDRYGDAVRNDVSVFTSGSEYVDTQVTDDVLRKNQMQVLMRILGLPEDHCCSPITGKAFYYYSNPPGGGDSPSDPGEYREMPPYFSPKVRIDPLPLP